MSCGQLVSAWFFPALVGVALGVMKDSALVGVLGYVELLKASQILITRTQEPLQI